MVSPGDRLWRTTRGQLIRLLRMGPQTVTDLAAKLSLTDNAVRAQLATLERDGLTRLAGRRRAIRKPNYTYELTADAERLFPKPYDAVLAELLVVLRETLPGPERQNMLREAGRRLARPHVARLRELPVRERLAEAVAILGELGGLAELHGEAGGYEIRGCSCPLSAAVSADPDACIVAEAMLGELVGVPVHEVCAKSPIPKCRFTVEVTTV